MMQENLNDKLLKARKNAGLSQEDVAKRLHISRQAVSNWEIGKTEPDLNSVRQLCEIYLISSDEILGIEGMLKSQDEVQKEVQSAERNKKVDMQALIEVLVVALVLFLASQVAILGVFATIVAVLVAFKRKMKGRWVILVVALIAFCVSIVYTYNLFGVVFLPDAGTATIEKLQ